MIDDFFKESKNFGENGFYLSRLATLLNRKLTRFYLNERWYYDFQNEEKLESQNNQTLQNQNLKIGNQQNIFSKEAKLNFHFYSEWKKSILQQIESIKETITIRSARICCYTCDDRIVDVKSLSEGHVFQCLRKATTNFLNSFKSIEAGNYIPASFSNPQIVEIRNKLSSHGLKIKELIACLNDHPIGFKFENKLVEFETNEENSIFIADFCQTYLKYPNNRNEKYENKVFNKEEIVTKEKLALKQQDQLWRNFYCRPCEFKDQKTLNELSNHFNSKDHLENVLEFSQILENDNE